jgi:hypothetical protein
MSEWTWLIRWQKLTHCNMLERIWSKMAETRFCNRSGQFLVSKVIKSGYFINSDPFQVSTGAETGQCNKWDSFLVCSNSTASEYKVTDAEQYSISELVQVSIATDILCSMTELVHCSLMKNIVLARVSHISQKVLESALTKREPG